MAVDEVLLNLCKSPTLRIYGWSLPCVSIGFFQSSDEVCAEAVFVRRPTGGGTVEHGHDLTYTVAFPRAHPLAKMGTAESYRVVHSAVAIALSSSGVEAHLCVGESGENSNFCFQKPVFHDVVDGAGRKLAGAAQRRTRDAVLHQGSLMVDLLPEKIWDVLVLKMTDIFQEPLMPDDLSAAEMEMAARLERERYSLDSWNHMR